MPKVTHFNGSRRYYLECTVTNTGNIIYKIWFSHYCVVFKRYRDILSTIQHAFTVMVHT